MSHRQEDLSRRGRRCRPHTDPTYPHSAPPPFSLSFSLSLAHAPPATFSRKSHRLTFRPSSDRGIKLGREAVSNILCSSSAIPTAAEDRVPTPSRDVRRSSPRAIPPCSLRAKTEKRTNKRLSKILSFRLLSNCVLFVRRVIIIMVICVQLRRK